jgi:peptidyl-prolyl cis-trans isomerase B (cyclophilin B)
MRAACVAAVAAALLASGCGGGSDDATSPSSPTGAATTAQQTEGCATVAAPAARADGGAEPPKERLDPEKTYALVFETSCGTFTVTLDLTAAPATSASLVSLARSGFYDDTLFHRIVPGFVIQGGDPTQSGGGGPGYSTIDKPPANAKYTPGTMAMAKASSEPPGTAGSQFFIVTGRDVGLPAEYAVTGKVTKGIATIERIGELGDASEHPTMPVVIRTVTVTEQG